MALTVKASHEIEQLRDELQSKSLSSRGPDPAGIIMYLRLVRETNVRESEFVARFGSYLLRKHSKMLGEEELWTVLEQVAVACLDCQAVECAFTAVDAILAKFPDSSRANRIMGMYYEATGHVDKATELYNKCLEDNPNQELLLKRQVAIKRSQGDLPGAIDLLKEYVSLHALDREAWEELADLYLQVQQYGQAAFCIEEMLMQSPSNVPYLIRYADVLYTMGGQQNLKTALTYYSSALQLTEGHNLRALYGATSCAAQLNTAKARGMSEDGVEVGELSAKMLLQRYSLECQDKLPLVKQWMAENGYKP